MTPTMSWRAATLLGALGVSGPCLLTAQGRGVEIAYGRWWHGDAAALYTLTYRASLLGAVDYGLSVIHVDDSRSADDRTLSGGEVSLSVLRSGTGPYFTVATGLGMRHRERNLDASWSIGGGYSLQPFPFLSLGLEARYRLEDRNVRGFWQVDDLDRRGLLMQARVTIGFGGGRGRPDRRPEPTPVFDPPSRSDVEADARSSGASTEAARVAASVVETALDAMGTPYKWGGSDQNGYDCSGLIQYAYQQHGILLPRVSREQARTGDLIPPEISALMPGDILGFAANGGSRVSHVGLYVGDGMFIHSSSTGVKLSSLTETDPDSRWWQRRWITARRILN